MDAPAARPRRRRRWGPRFGLVLSTLMAAAPVVPAVAGAGPAGDSGRGVTVGISSLYSVKVAEGTWLPIVVTMADRAIAGLHGQIVVTAPISPVADFSVPNCYTDGASTFCSNSASFSGGRSGSFSSAYGSAGGITYTSPLQMAAGTTKRVELYVLAGAPHGEVTAEILGASGRPLAKAASHLPVANGNAPPAVLAVTDQPGALSSLPVGLPVGPRPQVQALSPAQLPASAAALAAFSAVAIDEADTSVLSPGQRQALDGYVKAGGTLVLAGGLDWQGALDGVPDGLLPATVEGTEPVDVSRLAGLLGTRSARGRVDLDLLEPRKGSVAIIKEGDLPLAVEAGRGSGTVVLSAVDPAAPPLGTWAGTRFLMTRLLASAFQVDYSSAAGLFVSGTGPLDTTPATVPVSVMGDLGVGSDFDPMSPNVASGALRGYMKQLPGSAPSAVFFGLILLGYVLVAGPLCFMALARLRRRELAWVIVPSVALFGALATCTTGIGIRHSPSLEEIRVAQFAPGDRVAQVTSVGGAVVGPSGSRHITLTGPSLVTGSAAEGNAGLVVSPGSALGQTILTVAGRDAAAGGWAASAAGPLNGTLAAAVYSSAGTVFGHVTNGFKVKLTDVYLVTASGTVKDMGNLLPGASATFRVTVPAEGPGTGGNSTDDGFPATISTPSISIPVRPGSLAARHEAGLQGLYDLAALYSARSGGAPVLVAFSGRPILPVDADGGIPASDVTDAIVVPLAPVRPPAAAVAGVPPQVVGSSGVTGVTTDGLGTDSFTLSQGGYIDYEFLLGGGKAWPHLTLDLGSPSGQGPGAVGGLTPGLGAAGPARAGAGSDTATRSAVNISVFDYRTGTWARLRVNERRGQLVADVPEPGLYFDGGAALQVRLSALTAGTEVFGPVPALYADR